MSRGRLRGIFLDGQAGRIFCVLHQPAQPQGPCVLIAPPFADEMNKSRKMIATVAKQLESRGIAALLVDPFGTGDSDGEFAEADWNVWKADLALAARWSAQQGWPVTSLLAIRLGCILGCELVAEQGLQMQRTVLWQPTLSGSRFLDQFLRLRVAASMMEGDNKETGAALRERLRAGESLEVAGYDLSSRLADQLDRANLQPHLGRHLGELHWMELVRSADAQLPTPSIKAIEGARALDLSVSSQSVLGEPFWSATEIVINPALVEHTVQVLGSQGE